MKDNIDGFLEDGRFNPDNNHDRQFTKVRNVLIEMTEFRETNPIDYKTKDIEIKQEYYADQHYFYITDLKNQFLYIVTWYKGGAEFGCILFQGEIIDKEDFERFYRFLLREYGKWHMEKYK